MVEEWTCDWTLAPQFQVRSHSAENGTKHCAYFNIHGDFVIVTIQWCVFQSKMPLTQNNKGAEGGNNRKKQSLSFICTLGTESIPDISFVPLFYYWKHTYHITAQSYLLIHLSSPASPCGLHQLFACYVWKESMKRSSHMVIWQCVATFVCFNINQLEFGGALLHSSVFIQRPAILCQKRRILPLVADLVKSFRRPDIQQFFWELLVQMHFSRELIWLV